MKQLSYIHTSLGLVGLVIYLISILANLNLFTGLSHSFDFIHGFEGGFLFAVILCNFALGSSLRSPAPIYCSIFLLKLSAFLVILATVICFLTDFKVLPTYSSNLTNNHPWYSILMLIGGSLYFVLLSYNTCSRSYNREESNPNSGEPRYTGTVKWFNSTKGYGFISMDNGQDIFVHYRSISSSGRKILHDGQKVEFYIIDNEKGQQAGDVTVI